MTEVLAVIPERSQVDTVAALVEKYLQPHQPQDYRLVVHRHAIRLGTRRWLVEVGIEPEGKEIRADDLIERLIEANEELDRDFPRYIRLTQLVPQPGEVL